MAEKKAYKIFSDIVREKICDAIERASEDQKIYNYASEYCEYLENRDDKVQVKIYPEELTYFLLKTLEEVETIYNLTPLHPHHYKVIEKTTRKKIMQITSLNVDNYEDQMTITYAYISGTMALFMSISNYCYNAYYPNSIEYIDTKDFRVPYNFPFEKKILRDVIRVRSGFDYIVPWDYVDLVEIEQYIYEDAYHTKLQEKQKSKAAISWETLINALNIAKKENIDYFNTYLSKVLSKSINDLALYKQCSDLLSAKVDEILTASEQPITKEEHYHIEKVNGTVTGNINEYHTKAQLPPAEEATFDPESLPF